jgi:hypothetical protein
MKFNSRLGVFSTLVRISITLVLWWTRASAKALSHHVVV